VRASPPEAGPPLRVGASSCLLGAEVRATGGHCQDPFLLKTLGPWVTWVPVCPEVEMGMPVPRPTIRLVAGPEGPRLVASDGTVDHTEGMRRYGAERLEALAGLGLDGYVLKNGSPSCGLFRVRVKDANGVPSRDGRGLFARLLVERLPLLPVEEDGRLNDPRLRENFVERLFAHQRWRRFQAEARSRGDLVRFHAAAKLAVLAHSPNHYRELGRLVADAGAHEVPDLLDRYGRLYLEALAVLATPGRHRNVLEHLLGFLKEHLDAADRHELAEAIADHHAGLVPLVVPITLLKHHLRRHPVPAWALEQTYLNPYPRELMLRNHV